MDLLIPILSLGAIYLGAFVIGMGTGDNSGFEGRRAKPGGLRHTRARMPVSIARG